MSHTVKTEKKMKTSKTNLPKLNPYHIFWAIFVPIKKEYVSVHDDKILSGSNYYVKRKYTCRYFSSKNEALSFISNFKQALDDKYMVRIISDKQYGMVCVKNMSDIPDFPFTKKQNEEKYYIG